MKQTVFFKSILLVMVMLMLGVNMQAATMDDDTNEVSLTGKKWYYTKHDYIEFFEDGTNTYKKSYTYVHDRKNDRILFFKSDGTMYDYVNIYVLTETTLTIGKNDFKTYTTTPPKQLCEELEIAYPNWRITVKTGDKVTIAKSVLPADADDQSVTLYSYDPSVVEVDGETLQGVSPGVTTVKATTNDGSNLSAFCSVNVANETYQLDNLTFPMIETVDLGLPSGTLWADMNIGADAPFRMSKGFGEQMDVAPYVGSGWEYPTEAEFRELIDNCDVKLEEKASDFYWYQMMGYNFDYLRAAEFTSRINGNKLTLYVFTVSARGDYCYCLYPYCLQDGSTFSLIENVKECALNPVKEIETEEPKVLARLVKRGQGGTSIKGVMTDNAASASYYDLQGRRSDSPSRRGVYIKDGRKIIR